MQSWIKFRGISTEDKGLLIERMPSKARGKRRVRSEQILGRSGALHVDEDAYESITLKAIINIMRSKADEEIEGWFDGYGDLILSDDPDKCYHGIVIEEVSRARYRPYGQNYDSVSVMWECAPYLYSAEPEEDEIVPDQNPYDIAGRGTVASEPRIHVTGTGDVSLMVGDVTVSLSGMTGGTVTIDSEMMSAYTGDATHPVEITLEDREWPTLGPEETQIRWGGAVQRIVIEPNWRWL